MVIHTIQMQVVQIRWKLLEYSCFINSIRTFIWRPKLADHVFLPWSSSLSLLHPRWFEAGGTCAVHGICPQLQEGALAAARLPGSVPGARAAGEVSDCVGRTYCPLWERRARWTGPGGRPRLPAPSASSPRCAVGLGARTEGMWREKVQNEGRRTGVRYTRSEAEPHTHTPPDPGKNPLPWWGSLEERFDFTWLGRFSGEKTKLGLDFNSSSLVNVGH